jgi:hypothetical protein
MMIHSEEPPDTSEVCPVLWEGSARETAPYPDSGTLVEPKVSNKPIE